MTDHVLRLYALALAVLGFFVAWAAIAAEPWEPASGPDPDPLTAELDLYEQRLSRAARLAQLLAERRAERATASGVQARALAAAAPRIVTLPPLTVTRTS
ncbi:MAG: hypothetical protein FJW96_11375 [Actinobacteria bacterium]|nr:hypothetical protein [Actinomycetota bacterium]